MTTKEVSLARPVDAAQSILATDAAAEAKRVEQALAKCSAAPRVASKARARLFTTTVARQAAR